MKRMKNKMMSKLFEFLRQRLPSNFERRINAKPKFTGARGDTKTAFTRKLLPNIFRFLENRFRQTVWMKRRS